MSRLFKKTLVVMIGMFGLIAMTTSLLSGFELHQTMTEEYRSKGVAIAKGIASSSVELLLTRDASTVQATIDQYLDIDGVAYVFVIDDQQEIISHTFVPTVPTELFDLALGHAATNLGEHGEIYIDDLRVDGLGSVINVTVPILAGVMGHIHVGMDNNVIRRAFWRALIKHQGIVFVIFLACVAGAYVLVGKISSPLRALADYAHGLGGHDFSSGASFDDADTIASIRSRDEVGALAGAFRNLTVELQRSIDDLQQTTAVKERIESELSIARDIQMAILPRIFPAFPERKEVDVYASIIPAKEVGGDLYDFFLRDDDTLCVTIGDVSGKGVPAALFMAVTKTLIKSTGSVEPSPGKTLSKVNFELSEDNDSCMFATSVLGMLDIHAGKFVYSNGGHNPPFVRRHDGALEQLAIAHGPALGIVEGARYGEAMIQLEPGDTLIFYTDGVTEAMNAAYEEFSDSRLQQHLSAMGPMSSRNTVESVVAAVREFAAGAEQSDDIAVLALLWRGDEGAIRRSQWDVAIDARNDLREIQRIAALLEAFGSDHELSPGIVSQVTLAVEELLTNTISYGFEHGSEHIIRLRLAAKDGVIIIRIEDDGRPFDSFAEVAPPDTSLSIEERDIGGLGVHLVKNLKDECSSTATPRTPQP